MKKFIAIMLSMMFIITLIGCNSEVLPTKIVLSKTAIEVEKDVEEVITYTVEPTNATEKGVTAKSNISSIKVTVTASGIKIVAEDYASGTVTVTAKGDVNVKETIQVTVKPAAEVKPTKLDIEAPEQLIIGSTALLKVIFTPLTTTNKNVNWQSSDTTVATVVNGNVTGVKEGEVTITAVSAADNAIKASVTLNVIEGVAVESVEVVNQTDLLPANTPYTLVTNVLPVDATIKDLRFESSDTSVATISDEGVITGLKDGVTTITVTSVSDASKKVSFELTIDANATIPLESLTIKGNAIMFDYATQKLTATATPTNATVGELTWSSDNEAVATIDQTGQITVVSPGVVKFTVTNGTISADLEVTINPSVDPVTFVASLTMPGNGIKIGVPYKLSIAVTPENGNPLATYKSNDDTIATVDENGTIVGVSVGVCKITATSIKNPALKSEITVIVNDGTVSTVPIDVIVSGEVIVWMNYPIKLSATVVPVSASQDVKWSSNNNNVATVSSDGTVTPVSVGTCRIRAESIVDSDVYGTLLIEVIPEPVELKADLKGYEIIMMQADSALYEIDPFLPNYGSSDKIYKIAAWNEVQESYNCTIKAVAYPSEAPWGEQRITWIINNANNGTAQMDLGIVAANWIYRFGQADAAPDLTAFYNKYGKGQMEPAARTVGSYKGKLHIASTGISPTATYVSLGLYYNLDWVTKLGVEEPAKLFNEGKWTYSGFTQWALEVQALLDPAKNEKALGGHPYYYWFGLTNAAGVNVANVPALSYNISNPKSKEAASMMHNLVEQGAVDTVATWAETDGSFIAGTTVMTTGSYWFLRNETRWKKDLWDSNTSFGYVPFPYPDSMSKEDTRISVEGATCYLYSNGRSYPAGVGIEQVYQAINDMFLQTINKQKADPLFSADEQKTNALSGRLDSQHSIEAVKWFTAERVYFDPAHSIFSSTSATPLNGVSTRVLFQGSDYDTEFDAVYQQCYDAFIKVYG